MEVFTKVGVPHDVAIYSGSDRWGCEIVAQSNDGCDLFKMFGNVCFCSSTTSKVLVLKCVCVRDRLVTHLCNIHVNMVMHVDEAEYLSC